MCTSYQFVSFLVSEKYNVQHDDVLLLKNLQKKLNFLSVLQNFRDVKYRIQYMKK